VRKYFLGSGIAADRISTKGFGDSRSLVPNDTVENKRKNRRVVLIAGGSVSAR